MEHPSKRQRLSRVAGRPNSVVLGTKRNDDGNLTTAEADSDDDVALMEPVTQAEASPPDHPLELRTLSVPPNTQIWSSERRRAVEGRHRRLHRRRDNSRDEQKPPAVTLPLLVETLTIVDSVRISGTDPGIVVFPASPTASPSSGYGAAPGPTVPTSSSSLPTSSSTAPSYPFITASATETAGSTGNSTSTTSVAGSSSAVSDSSSTAMLGSNSQVVLSSPPSTPLPSSSSMALPPSPSGSSTGQSYFDQVPANSTTAPSDTQNGTTTSNSQTTPAPDVPYFLVPVNGSTSTIILSNNSTTFTATSVITVSSLALNSSISAASRNITSSTSTLQSSSFSFNTTSTSASSSSSSSTTTLLSTSTSTSASTTGTSATSTSEGVTGAGGAGTATGSEAAPTGEAGSGDSSGGSSGPSTPALVGGVVGGVAGLALLLVLLLMFLRWRKRKQKARQQAAVTGPESAPPQSRATEGTPSEAMTQRSSVTPFAAAGFLKRFRPTSQQTATTTETAPSERGFVNLGGRKLPSVFGPAGGDGYGGGYNRETLSGSSFYRDSQGFYGGPGTAGPSTSTATPGPSLQPGQRPESDVPVLRPSPARTPVTSQGPAAPMPAPPRGPPTPRPPTPRRPHSPDGIGRSHPSFDGSRGSRFREEDL